MPRIPEDIRHLENFLRAPYYDKTKTTLLSPEFAQKVAETTIQFSDTTPLLLFTLNFDTFSTGRRKAEVCLEDLNDDARNAAVADLLFYDRFINELRQSPVVDPQQVGKLIRLVSAAGRNGLTVGDLRKLGSTVTINDKGELIYKLPHKLRQVGDIALAFTAIAFPEVSSKS